LGGNFVQCFENVRASFWTFSIEASNVDFLYRYAGCAESRAMINSAAKEDIENNAKDWESAEVQAILGLLERSHAIWLSVLTLVTIVGL